MSQNIKNENTPLRESKKILVLGAGGFIGNNLVIKLKTQGHWVRGVDLKYPEYNETFADDFVIGDLRDPLVVSKVIDNDIDELYQLAADMGGACYIFTGENDANIMHNSALINLNVAYESVKKGVKKLFYSSSACIYPERNQMDPNNPNCAESSAYPADPDSEYGWEKIFSERLYLSFHRNYGLNVRIARFHNIFGPLGTWKGGKEKAPAAICRKIALCDNNIIEIFGDGQQTRSFLFIDECLYGIEKLMQSSITTPINIGSDEMVTINQLVEHVADIAGKNITIKHIEGPIGVRGRNSDNHLIQKLLNWAPNMPLKDGLRKTYAWIQTQCEIV